MRFLQLMLCIFLFSVFINANHAEFNLPVYGGSACPRGGITAVPSPDSAALSVIFTDYTVEVGAEHQRKFTRKNCDILIPVTLHPNMQVRLVGADYRGFNSLPAYSSTTLAMRYSIDNHVPTIFKQTFCGDIRGENFIVRHKLVSNLGQWSSCGVDVDFRIQTSLSIEVSEDDDYAFSTIDSLDLAIDPVEQSGINIFLEWRSC